MAAPRDKSELILLAFGIGLAAAIGRVDAGALAGGTTLVGGRTWTQYWLNGVGWGAFYAASCYWLGAAWFRYRLGLSGAKNADVALVRRVYLSAGQIVAIPVILKTVIDTVIHDTPLAASVADPTWENVMYLFFPIWSSIVAFIGVRSVFRARRGRAAFWFLILPGLFYFMMVGLAARTYVSGTAMARKGPASDVANATVFSSKTMTFSYPRNWSVMKADANYDPDELVSVRPVQDARITLHLFQPATGSEEIADLMAAAVMDNFKSATRPKVFVEWGILKGAGRSFGGQYQGGVPYTVWVFVAPLAEDLYLNVTEVFRDADAGEVRPGLDLIRRSFRIVPGPE